MSTDLGVADRRQRVRRRPQDVGALMGGALILLVTTWWASADTVGPLEERVFRFFNEWPDRIEAPSWPVMQAGSAAAIVISAAVVVAAWRNGRLALALLSAGGLAWIGAKLVKQIVQRGRPGDLLGDVIQRPEWEGFGFVSGHAAVAFALAAVASPYIHHRWKLVPWAVAAAAAVLRIYTGAHLPLDVIGGAVFGLAIAGAVNLVLGTPVDQPVAGSGIETGAA